MSVNFIFGNLRIFNLSKVQGQVFSLTAKVELNLTFRGQV